MAKPERMEEHNQTQWTEITAATSVVVILGSIALELCTPNINWVLISFRWGGCFTWYTCRLAALSFKNWWILNSLHKVIVQASSRHIQFSGRNWGTSFIKDFVQIFQSKLRMLICHITLKILLLVFIKRYTFCFPFVTLLHHVLK